MTAFTQNRDLGDEDDCAANEAYLATLIENRYAYAMAALGHVKPFTLDEVDQIRVGPLPNSEHCHPTIYKLCLTLEREVRKAIGLSDRARMVLTLTSNEANLCRWTVSGDPHAVRAAAALLLGCGMRLDTSKHLHTSEITMTSADSESRPTLHIFLTQDF